MQYLAPLPQCCVKTMKGLENQNMVIDTEFSLSALGRCDEVKICVCAIYDLSLKLEAYEPPILLCISGLCDRLN